MKSIQIVLQSVANKTTYTSIKISGVIRLVTDKIPHTKLSSCSSTVKQLYGYFKKVCRNNFHLTYEKTSYVEDRTGKKKNFKKEYVHSSRFTNLYQNTLNCVI